MDNPPETVVITKEEYETLQEESRILAALHAGGVDNWEWYEASLESLND